MSDLGFNVWGAVASVLGTVALIIPVFMAWVRPRLPTANIAGLVEIHKETQDLFATALRDGLITDPHDLHHFKTNLIDATIRVDALRADVYVTMTWRQDLRNWWNGMTRRIWMLRENLNALRAELAGRNSKERKRLASQNIASELSYLPDQKGSLHGVPSTGACVASSAPSPLSMPSASHQKSAGDGLFTMCRSSTCSTCFYLPEGWGSEQRPATMAHHDTFGSIGHNCLSSPSPSHLSQHLVSATDLHTLFSLALSRPGRWLHGRTRRPLSFTKRTIVTHASQEPFAAEAKGGARRSNKHEDLPPRLRGLLRLVRRVYGVDLGPRGVGGYSRTASCVSLDLESLSHVCVAEDGSENDADEWEEEHQ